jgi:predicted amidophosphoribosyltransferase
MGWFRRESCLPPGIPLVGSFDSGWALDTHSSLQYGEWRRTVVGEKLYRFKYRGNRSCGRWLARTCVDFLANLEPPLDVDLILTVPSSRPTSRLSPAEYVAARITTATGASCPFRMLYKTRPTRYIKEAMTYEHKRRIIGNTMAVRQPELIRGRKLLLIDDLYETGATSDEAIRALREADPAWIGFLAFTVVRGNR